jgi:DNA polymerase
MFSVAPAPERPPADGARPPQPRSSRPSLSAAYTPVDLPDERPLSPGGAQRALDQIRARYEADAPHARFHTPHTTIVFGEGDPCARLMFVGEAPGETEDRLGRPFVGRAGELLDKMIDAMGLSRSQVYIANVLKVRPPDNATPTPEQAEACAPYLLDQIRVVAPECIVTLGLPATKLLLQTDRPMRDLRGEFARFPPAAPGPALARTFDAFPDLPSIPVMPTYHPAYLLRSYTPENRRKVWSDLRKVCDHLGLTPR